ncbi:hypothetical protein [Arthrobacter sp. Soil736]|nr:hypothetical protein [Arthrobacter sp. Soil736]
MIELRGKDSRGRDVVLGRSVEYTHVRMMSRLAETHADIVDASEKEATSV